MDDEMKRLLDNLMRRTFKPADEMPAFLPAVEPGQTAKPLSRDDLQRAIDSVRGYRWQHTPPPLASEYRRMLKWRDN